MLDYILNLGVAIMSIQNIKATDISDNCVLLKLGEFADLAKINRDTLTFYIKKGLIKPASVGLNKYKYFRPEQVQTINTIKYLRCCRIPLETIREIMYNPSADNFQNCVDTQLKELGTQLEELNKASAFVAEIKKKFNNKNRGEIINIADFAGAINGETSD